jgi:hypothetical protein
MERFVGYTMTIGDRLERNMVVLVYGLYIAMLRITACYGANVEFPLQGLSLCLAIVERRFPVSQSATCYSYGYVRTC